MKKTKLILICCIIAFLCFAIVSYGHFYRGETALGVLFAVLSAAQVVIAVLQYKNNR